ncbi:WG repeat-containing protein [Sphingobacterium sp. Mn56C]|uniref:WG repeat-containing protein n=1 Tax=Sphingobacterium sp. Mn56C TaxID=3395261 RepID=UPI003BBBB625
MNKLALFFVALLMLCATVNAQTTKTFRIEYQVLSSNTKDNAVFLKAWTNKNAFRVVPLEESNGIYIANRAQQTAHVLMPTDETYATVYDGTEEDEWANLTVDFVPNSSKKIAGYTCKLAKISIPSDEDTDEDAAAVEADREIHIWYTTEVPNLYWGEFSFLKRIPGAALELTTDGNGIVASKVVQDNLPDSAFEIPADYTETTFDDDYGDLNVAEDRSLYSDDSGQLYGLQDEEGNALTLPIYSHIGYFSDDISVAIDTNQMYGAINKSGKVVIPFKFEFLSYDENSKQYLYSDNENYGLLDAQGKVFIPAKYESLNFFNQGYAIFSKAGKYGIIDTKQKVVVPAQYEMISEHNKLSFTVVDGITYDLYTIADNKRVAGGFELLSLSNDSNLILAHKDGKYGFIDEKGKTVIPFKFTFASSFADGQSTVTEDEEMENIYQIDTKGQRIKE